MAKSSPALDSPAGSLERAAVAALGLVEVAKHVHVRAGMGGPVPPEVVVPWLAEVVRHLEAVPLLDGIRAAILRARGDDNPARWSDLAELTWHDVAMKLGPPLARVLRYAAGETFPVDDKTIDPAKLQAEAEAVGRRLQESWRSQPLFFEVMGADFENLTLGIRREAELTSLALTTTTETATVPAAGPTGQEEPNWADELEFTAGGCLTQCNILRRAMQTRVDPNPIEHLRRTGNPSDADELDAGNRAWLTEEAKAWEELVTCFRRLNRACARVQTYAIAFAQRDFPLVGRTCKGAVGFCHQWAWELVASLTVVDAHDRQRSRSGDSAAEILQKLCEDLQAGRYAIDAEVVLSLGQAPRRAAAVRMTPWPTDEEVKAVRQELVSECSRIKIEWSRDYRGATHPPVAVAAGTEALPDRSGETSPGTTEVNGSRPRDATVNARMIEVIQRRPEAANWTAKQWATKLGCALSTVKETRTWKNLVLTRAEKKYERAAPRDRRRGRTGKPTG